MTAWLNLPIARVILSLLLCSLAGLAGWWWHRPPAFPDRPATAIDRGTAQEPTNPITNRDTTLGTTLQAADPFGLSRSTPLSASTVPQGETAADVIVWRFSAITMQRGQHHLLMTANDQEPLLLKKGDKLPNGERITSIDPTGLQLVNAAGRKRNIQLIEP